jgi:hypothetical protein
MEREKSHFELYHDKLPRSSVCVPTDRNKITQKQ